jgi:4-amino-4-deoxy-L-arabinose transferase-like glycosyltransferase
MLEYRHGSHGSIIWRSISESIHIRSGHRTVSRCGQADSAPSDVNRYGIFRDEMYYWAGSLRMAWGYVDHPPLTVWLAWIARHLRKFGIDVRILPAFAGAALVWLTGKLTREMGGGRFAQALASLAVVVVPAYLVLHHWLTDNAWESLIWMMCIWLIIRILHTGDERNWIWFGVIAGIGLKISIPSHFCCRTACRMLLTPQRHFLKSRYLWIGAVACALIALPNSCGKLMNHFPFWS